MEIKVKSVKAKEASVSISVDTKSAEVLKGFLVMAMDKQGLSDDVAPVVSDILEDYVDPCEVSEIICGIISGLDGE